MVMVLPACGRWPMSFASEDASSWATLVFREGDGPGAPFVKAIKRVLSEGRATFFVPSRRLVATFDRAPFGCFARASAALHCEAVCSFAKTTIDPRSMFAP